MWLDHFAEARSQLGILRLCEFALKHTVLHPLSVRLEDFVDLGATLILWDIVGNYNIHISSSSLAQLLPLLQNKRWIFVDFTHQVLCQQAGLDFKRFLISTLPP